MVQRLWNHPSVLWNQIHIHGTHLWLKVPWSWVKIKEGGMLNLSGVTQCFASSIYEILSNANAVRSTVNKCVIWPQTAFCSVGEMFPLTGFHLSSWTYLERKRSIHRTKPRRQFVGDNWEIASNKPNSGQSWISSTPCCSKPGLAAWLVLRKSCPQYP